MLHKQFKIRNKNEKKFMWCVFEDSKQIVKQSNETSSILYECAAGENKHRPVFVFAYEMQPKIKIWISIWTKRNLENLYVLKKCMTN